MKLLQKKYKQNISLILILLLVIFGFFHLIVSVLPIDPSSQFILLAQSFLHKRLYFSGNVYDSALYNGHYYYPLGPLPALILTPFMYISARFTQGYLSILLSITNFYLLFLIAKVIIKNYVNSLWLAFAYIFASANIFISFTAWSCSLSQVLATTLLLLALYELITKKRYVLVGIYIAFAISTRINLILSSLFFILVIIKSSPTKKKINAIAMFLLPICIMTIILMLYNYLRFNSFFETGYHYQQLSYELAENFKFGMWNIIHFPANIYYFIFKGPEAVFVPGTKVLTYPYLKLDTWGMSIVYTSPIFLYILFKRKAIDIVNYALLISSILLFFCLGYYGIGVRQFGYRYALDFYPFLYIALAYSFQNGMSNSAKILIVFSFIFNYYLVQMV